MDFEKIQNKTVLLRCDFNEPIEGGVLQSTKRIDANITTIHELLARKNKVILMSHHSDKGQTLLPIFNYLEKSFQDKIKYLNTTDTNAIKEYFEYYKNDVASNLFLLENTRLFFAEGVDKDTEKNLDEKNDEDFAKFLSSLAECYVYDAFSVGHREHASTTGVARLLPSSFGTTFLKEYSSLKKITDELSESLIFMGGAKLSTKLPLVTRFLNGGSTVCLGGAMIHPLLQEQKINIKDSYLEEGFKLEENILKELLKDVENKKLLLPAKLIWQNETKENISQEKIVDNVFDFENISEIILNNKIKNIMWNGPVGMYEAGSIAGTSSLSTFVSSHKKLFTVVGGGDTITFLEEQFEKDKKGSSDSFEKNFSYVSLSGGAMLEFLSVGTLPILKAIKVL